MKKPKKVKVVSEAAAKPCPKCGYCDHCGRSNQLQIAPYVVPYIYPQQPWYPFQSPFWAHPQITWGGAVGASGTTSQFTMSGNLGNQGSLGSSGLQGGLTVATDFGSYAVGAGNLSTT